MIRIITSILAVLCVVSVKAGDKPASTPKLVIGITIDQLRGDYLEFFKHNFGEKGFKSLMREGLYYPNMKYDFPNVNKASSLATIYTGANPEYHGVSSEKKYIPERDEIVYTYADNNYIGNYTIERYSPLALQVSTLGDELKIASEGYSDVFSLAPDVTQALSSLGCAGNVAYWIDDKNGKWCTTTYYKNVNVAIDHINRSNESLGRNVNSLVWTPAISVNKYDAFTYTKSPNSFKHVFYASEHEGYKAIKHSPFVNREVRKAAEKVISYSAMGKRLNPDFLSLTFYAGNSYNASGDSYSTEIQDTYYRLDEEIAQLIDYVDKHVGLSNALIFVASSGYFGGSYNSTSSLTLSGGDFVPERAKALLNMYLIAIYGKEQWVKKFYDGQIFFNKKKIEEKKINFEEFCLKASDFLVQFAGVQDVYTAKQILESRSSNKVQDIAKGIYRKNLGDIFIELQPGWRVQSSSSTDTTTDNRIQLSNFPIPLFFFGNEIKAQRELREIDAREIAPSVSYRLRIRSPNASTKSVLRELQYN